MKEQEKQILRSIGDIEDKLVDESFEFSRSDEKSDFSVARRHNKKKTTWKQALALAACLVLVIGIAGSGFMSKQAAEAEIESYDSSMETVSMTSNSKSISLKTKTDAVSDGYYKEADDFDSVDTEDVSGENSEYNALADAMLVYTADIDAQTTDYDEAVKTIKDMVSAAGGYIEAQSDIAGGYYSKSLRYASFSIRVPSDKYQEFVNGISDEDSGIIVYKSSETVDDIGLSYYETEERLNTLYIKEERLHNLLKEATGLSDIITLENELSETELEIDKYTQDLRRYTSLVNFSTVNLNLEEVYKADAGIEVRENFFTRLAKAFKGGFESFAVNLEYFILWIAENLISIVIIGIVFFLLLRFRPFTRLWRRVAKK